MFSDTVSIYFVLFIFYLFSSVILSVFFIHLFFCLVVDIYLYLVFLLLIQFGFFITYSVNLIRHGILCKKQKFKQKKYLRFNLNL